MKRYPLEAARKVRALGVEEAERSLADAIAILDGAERALVRAREESRAHAAREREEKEAAARREERGGSAAALSRSSAFLARRRREGESLAAAVRIADKAWRDARDAVDAARSALAEAKAEKDVVERHHDRFRGAEKRVREQRDELEAEDLAAARRGRE